MQSRMSHAESAPIDCDQNFLDRVLEPYKPNCRYIKTAVVDVDDRTDRLRIRGTFGIPESCYIADTGHFNSVEFNICYNQMAYCLIAKAVDESLISPFDSWSMEDYWERQLPNILIYDFRSRFRRPMLGASFLGSLEFVEVTQRYGDRPLVTIDTACQFSDGSGCSSEGSVKLAITDPPIRGR